MGDDMYSLSAGEKAAMDEFAKASEAVNKRGYSHEMEQQMEGVRGRREQHEARRDVYKGLRDEGYSRREARELSRALTGGDVQPATPLDLLSKTQGQLTQFPEGVDPAEVNQGTAGGASGTLTGYILIDGVVYNATFAGTQGTAV